MPKNRHQGSSSSRPGNPNLPCLSRRPSNEIVKTTRTEARRQQVSTHPRFNQSNQCLHADPLTPACMLQHARPHPPAIHTCKPCKTHQREDTQHRFLPCEWILPVVRAGRENIVSEGRSRPSPITREIIPQINGATRIQPDKKAADNPILRFMG